MSSKFLVIPEDAAKEVRALTALSAEQLQALDRALSNKALAKGRSAYRAVADQIGISYEAALGALSAVSNLRRQRRRFKLTDAQVLHDLEPLSDAPFDTARRTALIGLLGTTDEDYFVEKASSLRYAIGAHYVSSKTIIDLRPVFSRDRASVDGMLAVAYLELRTHSADHRDHACQTIQLSKKDIAELKEKLVDAELKLKRLEEQFASVGVYE